MVAVSDERRASATETDVVPSVVAALDKADVSSDTGDCSERLASDESSTELTCAYDRGGYDGGA